MPNDTQAPQEDYTHRLLFLRLGETIFNHHSRKFPDPYERPTTIADPPRLLAAINDQTSKLKALVSGHSSFDTVRKILSIQDTNVLRPEVIWITALLGFHDFLSLRDGQSVDSIAHQISPLLCNDLLEGKLRARRFLADLIERGIVVVNEYNLHLNGQLNTWFSGGNPLCVPRLHENAVNSHLYRKRAKTEAQKNANQPVHAPISTAQDIYQRLKKYIVANDAACRLLAVRGFLHLRRRELLQRSEEAGTNECLLIIGQSGTGKTYIAETFGKLCGLPFASLSASQQTATGYYGSNTSDFLKALVCSAGDPKDPQTLQRARYGVLFLDEWDKRRTHSGVGPDITGGQVQNEWLRLITGVKLKLGITRLERDEQNAEFNSVGTFFVFAGAFSGLDQTLKELSKERGQLGFNTTAPLKKTPKIYDALISYGMIPEFLNRVTGIITMKPLDRNDLMQLATSDHGVIQSYNRILAKQGLRIAIGRQGLLEMADFCIDTKLLARGIQLIVSSVVEDAVFSAAKGDVLYGLKDIRQAIEKVISVDGFGESDRAGQSSEDIDTLGASGNECSRFAS